MPTMPVIKRKSWITPALTATGFVLCIWLYPVYGTYFPKCIFHASTGLHCPGCGTQRAVVALARGDIALALQNNLLAVSVIAGMIGFWSFGLFRMVTGKQQELRVNFGPVFIHLIALILILFAVLRNLPVLPFSWLAPPG